MQQCTGFINFFLVQWHDMAAQAAQRQRRCGKMNNMTHVVIITGTFTCVRFRISVSQVLRDQPYKSPRTPPTNRPSIRIGKPSSTPSSLVLFKIHELDFCIHRVVRWLGQGAEDNTVLSWRWLLFVIPKTTITAMTKQHPTRPEAGKQAVAEGEQCQVGKSLVGWTRKKKVELSSERTNESHSKVTEWCVPMVLIATAYNDDWPILALLLFLFLQLPFRPLLLF